MMRKFFSFCGGLLLPLAFVNAAPVAYSGKVAVNGANFEGEARFKFSFTDANGTVLWSHSSDANASLPVDVVRGHYFVLLGENMNPIPNNLFIDHPAVYLRVHFRSTAEGPFLHLLPDQRIASAPHALSADIATSVKLGSVTRNHLASEVLAELNATINRSRLAADILSDLNRSIAAGSVTRDMLAAEVRADLNASLSSASVTAANIHPDLVKYFLPEISGHPAGVMVLKGTGATLSSTALGKFLTYQWKKNGENLSGENNATLVLADANASLHDGNYSVVVSNDWGSVASNVATFTVATNPPVIILEGNASVTHEGGLAYVDPGATASDALNGNLTAAIVVTGSVDVNETGQNQIKYNVTDAGGNAAAEKVRTVTVVDTTPPVISLIGDANLTHTLNTAWNDPGFTAADTLDGNLSGQVSIAGSVDVNQTGSTVLTYSVSDAAGNAATPVTRTVNIAQPPSGPWNFTSAGASGRFGPTQAQVDANYSGTTLSGKVTINIQGIQEWIVPATGTYRIETCGAQGGDGTNNGLEIGAKGSLVSGEFLLSAGDVLNILVGQRGASSNAGGGGGGTFVWRKSNQAPLVIAGGGGGSVRYTGDTAGKNGVIGSNATSGSGTSKIATGGTGGNGGSALWEGSAGAGWLTNGQDGPAGCSTTYGGKRPLVGGQGGAGSSSNSDGGFGGGGGGGTCYYSGGGAGGYSGGAGSGGNEGGGGGGGSYNAGNNQSNTAGANSGHGKVTITFVGN